MLSPGPGGGRAVGQVLSPGPGGGREGGVVTWSLVHTSPPVSGRMTNTCENITFDRFATRAVKITT